MSINFLVGGLKAHQDCEHADSSVGVLEGFIDTSKAVSSDTAGYSVYTKLENTIHKRLFACVLCCWCNLNIQEEGSSDGVHLNPKLCLSVDLHVYLCIHLSGPIKPLFIIYFLINNAPSMTSKSIDIERFAILCSQATPKFRKRQCKQLNIHSLSLSHTGGDIRE